jgi:hypothetical protein
MAVQWQHRALLVIVAEVVRSSYAESPLEIAQDALTRAQTHAEYEYTHYKQIQGQKIADTINIKCPYGKVKKWKRNSKSTSGKEYYCAMCDPGTRAVQGTCFACAPGQYQNLPGTEKCKECAAGFYNPYDGVSNLFSFSVWFCPFLVCAGLRRCTVSLPSETTHTDPTNVQLPPFVLWRN